jgi:L-iditol 2-dehydrogenase
LIVEAAGSNKALETTLEQIDHKGRIVVVGRETGDTVVHRSIFEDFMRKESRIIGCWGYKIKDDEQILLHSLKKNLLKIQPLISHRFFLSEGVKIVEEMWKRDFFFCKVLFDIGE